MNKRIVLQALAVISAVCLCAVLCITPKISNPVIVPQALPDSEVVKVVDTAAAPIEQSTEPVIKEYSEEQLKVRVASMLNLNRCCNDAFSEQINIANASALALFDYSTDIQGFGLCVNTCLVEGFAKSFYGVELDSDLLDSTDAPQGYFAIPTLENGTQVNSVVSITRNGDVYEVISSVTTYYGGDDTDVAYTKAVFVVDIESEFGFNLISCEIL